MRESLERGLRVAGVLATLLEHPVVSTNESFRAGVDSQKSSVLGVSRSKPMAEKPRVQPETTGLQIKNEARVASPTKTDQRDAVFKELNDYLGRDSYVANNFTLEELCGHDDRPVALTAEIKNRNFRVSFISIIPGEVGYTVESISDFDSGYTEYNLHELPRVLRAKIELSEMLEGMRVEIDDYVATALIRSGNGTDLSSVDSDQLQKYINEAKQSPNVQKWVKMIEAHVEENL